MSDDTDYSRGLSREDERLERVAEGERVRGRRAEIDARKERESRCKPEVNRGSAANS